MIRPETAQPQALTPWCETQLNILTTSEANMRTSAFVTNNAPVVNKQGLLTLGIGKTDTANEGFWAFCRNVETGLKAGRVQTEINEFIEYHKKVIRCAFGKPLFLISNKELAYIEVNINLLNRIVSHCHKRFYEGTPKPEYFDTRFLAGYLRGTVHYALNKEGVADAIARLRLNGVITWDNPHFVDLMESYKKIQSSELLRTYLGHHDPKTKRFLTIGKACQLITDTEEQLKKLPYFQNVPSCMVALKQALRNNVLYNEDVEKGAQLLLDVPDVRRLFPQFAALGARYLRPFAPIRLPADVQRIITVNHLRDHPFTEIRLLKWISDYHLQAAESFRQQQFKEPTVFEPPLDQDSSPEHIHRAISIIYQARNVYKPLLHIRGPVNANVFQSIKKFEQHLSDHASIFEKFRQTNEQGTLSELLLKHTLILFRALCFIEEIKLEQMKALKADSEKILADAYVFNAESQKNLENTLKTINLLLFS